MLKKSVPPSESFSDFDASMRCAMYDPPPGSAPGYQLAHQPIEIGRMKIIIANSDIEKFGKISRNGCPRPFTADTIGSPFLGVTTCSVESFSTSACKPSHALSSPTRRRPTSLREKYAAAKTAVILIKNWIMSMIKTPHRPE